MRTDGVNFENTWDVIEACRQDEKRHVEVYCCWCRTLPWTSAVDLVAHWNMYGGWRKHLAEWSYGQGNRKDDA